MCERERGAIQQPVCIGQCYKIMVIDLTLGRHRRRPLPLFDLFDLPGRFGTGNGNDNGSGTCTGTGTGIGSGLLGAQWPFGCKFVLLIDFT